MMMPTAPSANFIVGQAGLALAALNAFFNAMLRLGYTITKSANSDIKCAVGQDSNPF